MFYEYNNIISYIHKNLPVILWKSVWGNIFWGLSKTDPVPAPQESLTFQEQTLHHLLLGFPWCLTGYKPSNLLSLLKTRVEIAYFLLKTTSHSCLSGQTKEVWGRENFLKSFSGQRHNFHWDHNFPGQVNMLKWLDTNQILHKTVWPVFWSLIFITKTLKTEFQPEVRKRRSSDLLNFY